jgi:hypothetical protein
MNMMDRGGEDEREGGGGGDERSVECDGRELEGEGATHLDLLVVGGRHEQSVGCESAEWYQSSALASSSLNQPRESRALSHGSWLQTRGVLGHASVGGWWAADARRASVTTTNLQTIHAQGTHSTLLQPRLLSRNHRCPPTITPEIRDDLDPIAPNRRPTSTLKCPASCRTRTHHTTQESRPGFRFI